MKTRIGFISDTHTKHISWEYNLKADKWGYEAEQKWNSCDILVFSGDCTSMGYQHEVQSFLKWFSEQPAKIKIMIAGNHDFFFDHKVNSNKPRRAGLPSPEEQVKIMLEDYPEIIYLDDSGTEQRGLKFWGSPIQPWFHNWAFNRQRGPEIQEHWDMIPNDTDILITHGPPKGILDRISPKFERYNEDPNVGCSNLLAKIQEVKPIISVFGHIHEGYGTVEIDDVIYINASCLNDSYSPQNPPQFIDLEY